MAQRKLIVELVGDSRSLERTFGRSSKAAKQFGRDMDRTARGVIAGTGAFRSLGRSVAFASSAFLGGVGIVAAIKSTISAAEESQRVIAQTQVAVKNAGQSWETYGAAIEFTAKKQQKLTAFSDEQLLGSFSQLIRRTGDVRKAFRLNALAADVARGRNIDLKAATQLVIRASLGMAGALRRVGIGVKNGATGTQLLALLQKKYAGAAQAYSRTASGAMDRFRNAIDDVQEALGKGLLPQLTRLLEKASDWLDNANNQRAIVATLSGLFQVLGNAIKVAVTFLRPLIGAVSALAHRLGGWKTAIELAVGAFVGFKAAGIASAIAVEVANVAAAEGVAAAWRAALISTGWGALAAAAGAAAVYVVTHWQKVKYWFAEFWQEMVILANKAAKKMVEPFSHIPSIGGKWARALKDVFDQNIYNARIAQLHMHGLQVAADKAAAAAKRAKDKATGADTGTKDLGAIPLPKFSDTTGTKPKGLTWLEKYEQVYRRLQLNLTRAQQTKSFQDDLAALKAMEASVRAQLKLHRSSIDLQEKLVDVIGQRKDLEQQITDAQRERVKGRQFRALGLTAGGDEVVPGVKALRRALAHVNTAVEGTFLDTRKTRSMLSRIRKVLAGGLGAVGRDVRAKVKEILAGIDQQLKDHQGDKTRFRHANTAKLLAGLGLSGEQLRAVRARVATIGPNGVVPGRSSAAFAGAVNIGTVHVHGVQNPRQFEDHMRKRQRSRPAQRRGV